MSDSFRYLPMMLAPAMVGLLSNPIGMLIGCPILLVAILYFAAAYFRDFREETRPSVPRLPRKIDGAIHVDSSSWTGS